MDNTGRIHQAPAELSQELENKLHRLTATEAEKLWKLKQESRLEALEQMRAHPLAQLDAMTADDVRQLRNALKAQRRKRRGKR